MTAVQKIEGTCKGCGAPVYFVRSLANMKWQIVDQARTTIVNDAGQVVQGHVSHWATCPKADQFRKKEGD